MILAYTRTPGPDEPDNTPALPVTAAERWPNLPALWQQARRADTTATDPTGDPR